VSQVAHSFNVVFLQPESSLSSPLEPIIGHFTEPFESSNSDPIFKIHFDITSIQRLGISSGFCLQISGLNIVFVICLHATRPRLLIILVLITLIMCDM
jgi:hypothetical protein